MKKINCSILLAVILVIALAAGMWLAGAGRGQAQSMTQAGAANQTAPQLTSTPGYLTPGSPATTGADTPPPTNWLGVIFLFFCGMVGLMVFGVGAAILMVKLRGRFR